ncbi:MAG: MFS transporter [archaeon]
MAGHLSEKKRRESLKYSVKDGVAYAVMENTGTSYISPLAIAMNASIGYIGLLASLPGLISSLLQAPVVKLLEKRDRKEMIVSNVLWQALLWLPIALIAIMHRQNSLPLLMLFYIALASFNAFIIPAWNSWMRDIVTKKSGQYFGKRNRISGLVGIVTLLAMGYLLDAFKRFHLVFIGFSIIFLIAFIARIVSLHYLKKQSEPEFKLDDKYYFSFWQFIKNGRKTNFGKFAIYIGLAYFAVYVASPFITVYMLRDMKLDYITFTILNVLQSLSMLLTMPLWGKFADKYGNLKSIKISGWMISLVPILWMFSTDIRYLAIVQIFSGVVWASFNLSSSNFIYNAVSRERMGLCIAYSNILSTFGMFLGSVTGGYLIGMIKTQYNPLLVIFLLSGFLRLLVYLIMVPKIKEVRTVRKFNFKGILLSHLLPHNPRTK